MVTHFHPGVYVEQVSGGARAIEPLGTSTAAFLGSLKRGELLVPIRLTSYERYLEEFSGFGGKSEAEEDMVGLSVRAYFLNGGTAAYVMRVGRETTGTLAAAEINGRDSDATLLVKVTALSQGKWGSDLRARLEPRAGDDTLRSLKFVVGREASGFFVPLETYDNVSFERTSGDFLETRVNGTSKLVKIEVALAAPAAGTALNLQPYLYGNNNSLGRISASLAGLDLRRLNDSTLSISLATDAPAPVLVTFTAKQFSENATLADVVTAIRGAASTINPEVLGDRLVLNGNVTIGNPGGGKRNADALLRLSDGFGGELGNRNDLTKKHRLPLVSVTTMQGAEPDKATTLDYEKALVRLEDEREVNIICLPDCPWGPEAEKTAIVQSAVAHCEKMMNRMVLVDPPKDVEFKQETDLTGINLGGSSYSVLYYPWVRIPNPNYVSGANMDASSRTLLVPPSGFAAGIWARTDSKRGVWKAPAGVDARLVGVAELTYAIDDAKQDVLNPLGVNCFRSIPGAGYVAWGARTLATRMDPEWRYVPVRRTALMIGESIRNGIQWAVFEPNDASLWRLLRVSAQAFMNSLFRAGAFQGTTANQAYFVRCGLDDGTMTQDNIDKGEVILLVGFAPVKPAEFVIVRIQQAEGRSSISIAN